MPALTSSASGHPLPGRDGLRQCMSPSIRVVVSVYRYWPCRWLAVVHGCGVDVAATGSTAVVISRKRVRDAKLCATVSWS